MNTDKQRERQTDERTIKQMFLDRGNKINKNRVFVVCVIVLTCVTEVDGMMTPQQYHCGPRFLTYHKPSRLLYHWTPISKQ